MSDVIAEGWDEAKAREHLANLRQEMATELAIAEAFGYEAECRHRSARYKEMQIATCLEMFGKPRAESPRADA